MISTLEEIAFEDKRVFVRVDFNVPIRDGKISEAHRIDATLPTLRELLPKARKIIVASHLGRPGGERKTKWSLAPVRPYLEQSLSCEVAMAPDCVGPEVEALVAEAGQPKVVLLENLRFHREEEANDPAFSRALASLADVYINDAFGTAHRAHASTVGMVRFFRARAAGLLFARELDYLGRLLSSPQRPLIAMVGGAKVSDKIGVLRNLIPKVDSLLLGGGMAYTFLKATGLSIGRSLLEEAHLPLARDLLAQAETCKTRVFLPLDHVTSRATEGEEEPSVFEGDIPLDQIGLDIGPKTVARFSQELRRARTVLWNGPMGMFEQERFSHGTESVAQALAQCKAISIIAGGDTVAAVRQAGVGNQMTHLSTGGGATLEFLEGKSLPGVQALEGTP